MKASAAHDRNGRLQKTKRPNLHRKQVMSKGVQITIAALSICAGTFWFLSSGSGGEGTFAYYQSVRDFAQ